MSNRARVCVFCREIAHEEARCLACQSVAHFECRDEFQAQTCPTIGCEGEWLTAERATLPSAGRMPISAQLKASQCASLLALVMLFPFSVGLLWAGAAGNQGSIQRLVGELTAARRWEGPPARGDHEVYFERIELHPRRREDLGASPLGGEPLICWHHERKVRNRRGGGSSWRDVQRGGVACVGTSSTRESLALDLSTARFPLGLPILNEEGAERVRGLRSAAQVTVLASKVDLRGGVLHVGEARVFPTATWSEALAQAQDWERRTASFQGSLTTWGRLLLVLGLGGLFASTLWRHGLRRRLSPASQGG